MGSLEQADIPANGRWKNDHASYIRMVVQNILQIGRIFTGIGQCTTNVLFPLNIPFGFKLAAIFFKEREIAFVSQYFEA